VFNRPVDPNTAAQNARRQALIEDGLMGHPHSAPCAMAPATDKVTVQRIGPAGKATTLVGVTIQTQTGMLFVNVEPGDARRLAVAMLDAADQADGTERLGFKVPATPAQAADLLKEGLQ
jgi:hypothetical protein